MAPTVVRIAGARGIAPKEGLNDSYCILGEASSSQAHAFQHSKHCVTSEIQFGTLAPTWKESLFSVSDSTGAVRIEVWGKDQEKDYFLGYAVIDVNVCTDAVDTWVPLHPRSPKDEPITGEVHLTISKPAFSLGEAIDQNINRITNIVLMT